MTGSILRWAVLAGLAVVLVPVSPAMAEATAGCTKLRAYTIRGANSVNKSQGLHHRGGVLRFHHGEAAQGPRGPL